MISYKFLAVLAVIICAASFAPWYAIVRNRRHPDQWTRRSYVSWLAACPMMVFVLWDVWRREQGTSEGQEALIGALATLTAAFVVWMAIFGTELMRLQKGGPEALLAKAGKPEERRRDLGELCYVGGQWIQRSVPGGFLLYVKMAVILIFWVCVSGIEHWAK